MGLDVVQAAQAVGRAFAGGVGAADVLRERGVLELIKSFKGVEDLTANDASLISGKPCLALSRIQPPGIAGIFRPQWHNLLPGIQSNTMDVLTNLSAYIGSQLTPELVLRCLLSVGLQIKCWKNKHLKSRSDRFRASAWTLKFWQTRYERLRNQAELTKDEQADYKETIDSLMSGYPNYLKNIDLERDSWDKVSSALKAAGQELQQVVNAQIQEGCVPKVFF